MSERGYSGAGHKGGNDQIDRERELIARALANNSYRVDLTTAAGDILVCYHTAKSPYAAMRWLSQRMVLTSCYIRIPAGKGGKLVAIANAICRDVAQKVWWEVTFHGR